MSKTYAEYLAENKSKTFSTHMMPPGAKPKYSKGDTQAARERVKEMHRRGIITIDEVPVHINGMIDKSGMKKIKRKIYTIQEASHGR